MSTKECRHCTQVINAHARMCHHCNSFQSWVASPRDPRLLVGGIALVLVIVVSAGVGSILLGNPAFAHQAAALASPLQDAPVQTGVIDGAPPAPAVPPAHPKARHRKAVVQKAPAAAQPAPPAAYDPLQIPVNPIGPPSTAEPATTATPPPATPEVKKESAG